MQPWACSAAGRPRWRVAVGRPRGLEPAEMEPDGPVVPLRGMTNQVRPHVTDIQRVGALFGRALEGDEEALRRLHELVFSPQAHPDSRATCLASSALRALAGPKLDGSRPANAPDIADSPWVVAYVDQLLVAALR